MSVIKCIASRARRLMRMAIAASPNATVVSIAQNIWLGGIHFGTSWAVFARQEYLTQRKGNRADAESKARQPAEHYCPCGIRLSRSVQRNRAAE